MRFVLVLAVTIDDVHREGVLGDRRYNLDVKLIPATRVEIGAVPVSEERADCALLVWCLHASDELAVCEFLIASDSTRFESRGLSYAHRSD